MGKGIKTKSSQKGKASETAGGPGWRMKRDYIRRKREGAGGAGPPPSCEKMRDEPCTVQKCKAGWSPTHSFKRIALGQRMKQAFLHRRDVREKDQSELQAHYAVEQVEERTESALHFAGREIGDMAKRIGRRQQAFSGKGGAQVGKGTVPPPAARAPRRRSPCSGNNAKMPRHSEVGGTRTIHTRRQGEGFIKVRDRPAVRIASRAVKGPQPSARGLFRNGQQSGGQARAAVQTVKKAQAIRARGHAAAIGAKRAAAVSAKAARALLAAAKTLNSAMLAGGGVILALGVMLCLIGLMAGSCFGIFFSGEDSGTGRTIRTAMQEINQDYQARLEQLKASHTYDVLEISGSQAVWKEVLAVYAVKTTTEENGQDVASMDEEKVGLLAEMFWGMNQLSANTTTRTETIQGEEGETVETEVTVLVISVFHKTAQEMAEQLGFDTGQKEQLQELLSPEFDDLWNELLYGIAQGGGNGDLVAVAQSQVGNVGGQPYWSWYGFSSRVEWCAIFVSWCAEQCGLLDSGAVPKFSGCGTGINWFQSRGQWLPGSATPEPGMIIFFKWYGSDSLVADHVGIVERVENGRVYTIEGNSNDMVRRRSYAVGYGEIVGYGVPLG